MSYPSLDVESIRMLAELKRQMDSGERPFVVTPEGERLAVMPHVMQRFGLLHGQRVSGVIVLEIMRAHLAQITHELDEQQAKKSQHNGE